MLKKQLRKVYLQRRKQQIENRGSLLYSKIEDRFSDILQREFSNKVSFIGSYIFTPGKEIIPPQLKGFSHAYPYFRPKMPQQIAQLMLFKEYQFPKKWNNQVYGIKVPPLYLPTVYPQIIIVPFLCFNPSTKQRVGYGGGYYDQYIKHNNINLQFSQFNKRYRIYHLYWALFFKTSNKKTIFVGIGYQCLKQQSIFSDPYDQKLDYIITQSSIY